MDESGAVISAQADMPTSNPVEQNYFQDGLGSEKARSKAAASKASNVRAKKGVKEISKSMKKMLASPTKGSAAKTKKPTVGGAKKVSKTGAIKAKIPLKKKAVASKDKKPKKSSKAAGAKKTSARLSTKASKK